MTENIEMTDAPKSSKDLRQWVGETGARFDEEAKPKEVSFKLSYEALVIVEEIIRLAREHGGTASRSRAFVDVCEHYLKHGPHVRAIDKITIRHELREAKLERLMKDLGSKESIETFNRVFPEWAIHFDFPEEEGEFENDK